MALNKVFCQNEWPVIPSQCRRTSNAEQEHEGELLSMMICTSMWNLKTIGEFGSEFTAVFLQWTHSAGVIQCPALGKDIHV